MKGREDFIGAYIHARYHENMPKTMADIANSRARRRVEAARVPRASLDMVTMWKRGCGLGKCDGDD